MQKKWPIPAGFVWSHAKDIYVHPDGRTWNSNTNTIYDKDGMVDTGAGTAAGAQESVEQMIQRHGLEAPRVTPADIEAVIDKVEFHRPTGTLMLCVITLKNGFTVTGTSACASPENFKQEVGERVSRENAVRKIWPLLGYQLRQKLYDGAGK